MVSLEDKIEDAPEGKIFQLYYETISSKYGKYVVILFWIGIIVLGVLYGFDFLNQTIFEFSAPKGTDGATAHDQFNQYFSSQANLKDLVILYKCKDNICGTFNPIYNTTSFNKLSIELNNSLYSYSSKHNDIVYNYQDYRIAMEYVADSPQSYKSQAIMAQKAFINKQMNYAIGVVQYQNNANEDVKNNFIDWLHDNCIHISTDKMEISMTGESALIKDMNEESKKDVERKDVITIPIALIVLAIIVQSWRLMFIPILNFGFAMNVLNVSPFTPSIMMSVSIAMSIDYSLFLLTRYKEEVEKKMRGTLALNREKIIQVADESARQTTRWSGKVICLSGAILASTYACLIVYPLSALQSMGLGASIAIICTIIVNMTLTPAILLIFPQFFSKFGVQSCICIKRNKDIDSINFNNFAINNGNAAKNDKHANLIRQASDISASFDEEINEIFSIAQENNLENEAKRANRFNRCWYKCGIKTTQWPYNLILCTLIYGAIMPVCIQVIHLRKQLQDTLIFPRGSDYLNTYNEVSDNFGSGIIAPWKIVIPSPTNFVVTNEFINETGIIISNFWSTLWDNDYQSTIVGQAFIGFDKNNDGFFQIHSLEEYNNIQNTNYSLTYSYITGSKSNLEATAVYYQMTTTFDPYFYNAIEFVKNARDWLYSECETYGYDCYLVGGSVAEVDSVNTTFASFPYVLTGIIVVVFSIMGIVFKSVFVPFRLLITIILPMFFVYGLAILVYQNGILNSLNWEAVQSTDGLYWLIPVMTVTILVGLALDYDIFLFARIYEYRVLGNIPTKNAIVRGVFKTGSIITAAGVIMSIAFCGLLLSNITSLNQTGFILVVAVLVDTFIIRTSLVPAVLSLAGEINWWPGLKDACNNPNDNIMTLSNNNNNIKKDLKPLDEQFL